MSTPNVVVFDLGKVLVDFDYSIAIRRFTERSDADVEQIQRLVNSPIQVDYESGKITTDEFYAAIREGAGFLGDRAEFVSIFADIFSPMETMIEFFERLKPFGIPTCVFSNTNEIAIGHIREGFPFYSLFDNYVLSFEGARVVLVGRNADSVSQAESALGQAARGLAGDATDSQTAAEAIGLAKREFGGFDGLYHVAGGSGRSMGDGPLHGISDDGWRQTIDLNLTSVFNSNRAALREFAALGRGGVILNMTSVLADSPAPRQFATHAYTAAKAGILGFTRHLASEAARYGITVNAVCPGLIDTEMIRSTISEERARRYAESFPISRLGAPSEVADLVAFLASDKAAYITGAALDINGGDLMI